MTTTSKTKTISTGNFEVDKRMAGGIPVGSLALIEGPSDSGKSVLCQHLAYGGLINELGVAYYTTENTVKSLLTQMGSLALEVTDYFLIDHFRVYPIQVSAKEVYTEGSFARLVSHMETLPDAFRVVVIDSLTNIVTHTKDAGSIMDFFMDCKALCDEGRTVFMVIHSHAFPEDLLIRVRSLSDAHLQLRLEEVGEKMVNVLEVSRVRNAARSTGNVVSFEVEPAIGMRIIPINKPRHSMGVAQLPFPAPKRHGHKGNTFNCPMFRMLPKGLQERSKESPYLWDYLHMVPIEKVVVPEYHNELTRKMGDMKDPNLIYPVGNGLFIHIYPDLTDARDFYIAIEPGMMNDVAKDMEEVEVRLVDFVTDLEEGSDDGKQRIDMLIKSLDKVCKVTKGGKSNDPKARKDDKVPLSRSQYNALRYQMVRDKEGMGILDPLTRSLHRGYQL